MITVKYDYSTKHFKLKPYNTKQEKSLLLMDTVGDNDISTALEICGINKEVIETLTHNEKLLIQNLFVVHVVHLTKTK